MLLNQYNTIQYNIKRNMQITLSNFHEMNEEVSLLHQEISLHRPMELDKQIIIVVITLTRAGQ